jgi:hypothetical protein
MAVYALQSIKRANVNRRAGWQYRDTAKECAECVAVNAECCGRQARPFAFLMLRNVNHGLAFQVLWARLRRARL